MQGQSRRGGLPGGRRGGPGSGLGLGRREGSDRQPNLFGNTPVSTPQGIGGMTPGPGPGGVMVAGATPPRAGQSVAQGGTTAGFAGQGGGRSLQNLFSPQPTPAQGIATIPTDQGVMFGPPAPPPSFFNRPDLPAFGFAFEDVYGTETPAYESGEDVLDNLKNILDSIRNPEFDLGPGTINLKVDPFAEEGGINFTVPLGPQSSLINPDTSGIMQMAEVTAPDLRAINFGRSQGLGEVEMPRSQFPLMTDDEYRGVMEGTITEPGEYEMRDGTLQPVEKGGFLSLFGIG